MSVSTHDAAVEALVGDLSRIRAPRGTQLNARSWQTEAPLRMLLNNLDAEVAERPEDLVVYGGSGRAARSHDALRAIVRTLLRLRRRRDAARPERQAGRRLPHARGGAARPDRELAARAALGDVGRVPAARGRGTDDVRADDRRELDLHRHPGDPPGHLPDLCRRRRGALRLGRPERPDDPDRRTGRDGWRAAARGDDGRRGDSLHRGRPLADRSAGSRRGISTRSRTPSRTASPAFAPRPPKDARCRSRSRETPPKSCRNWHKSVNLLTSSPTRLRPTIR